MKSSLSSSWSRHLPGHYHVPESVQYRVFGNILGDRLMRQSAILFLTLILGSAAFAQTSPTGPHKPAPAPEPVKAAGPGSSLPASAQAAMKAIDPNHIKAHVRFLSSDLLEG